MGRILTDPEISELTGYEMPGKQLQALREFGLRPMIRADGRPRITDDALTQAILSQFAQPASSATPNWSALKKAG